MLGTWCCIGGIGGNGGNGACQEPTEVMDRWQHRQRCKGPRVRFRRRRLGYAVCLRFTVYGLLTLASEMRQRVSQAAREPRVPLTDIVTVFVFILFLFSHESAFYGFGGVQERGIGADMECGGGVGGWEGRLLRRMLSSGESDNEPTCCRSRLSSSGCQEPKTLRECKKKAIVFLKRVRSGHVHISCPH